MLVPGAVWRAATADDEALERQAQAALAPTAHQGFPRDVLAYDPVADKWTRRGDVPFSLVTTPLAVWRGQLVVPGGELIVNRDHHRDHAHEDVFVAMRDSFLATRRRLEDHVRRLQGEGKRHVATARRTPYEAIDESPHLH
jgi:hypothetical protein